MKRDEDQEQTLIFVDMLGFAALIEKHPCRIEDAPPTDDGYKVEHTAPTQSQFNRFNQVLDRSIQQRDGGITAMLFSDWRPEVRAQHRGVAWRRRPVRSRQAT